MNNQRTDNSKNEKQYLSVSALNKYLYYKFDNDLNLKNVYIKAEISNVRFSKGILYFVLKDNESEIDGLMFGNVYNSLNFKPEDGMTVLVNGPITLYVKRGTYSITCWSMEQVGLGEAYLNFLMLKDKLLKEGLFEEDKKLPIPKYPKNIGLITSGNGDAINDVISTINKRYPYPHIYLYPAIVQGADAPSSLIYQVNHANEDGLCDVLIIARGGGSLEDLSCFNDEELARTIFNSKIPTISGVGHEADFTICDFVASRRAPTPTGAAVLATPDKMDLYNGIIQKRQNMSKQIVSILTNKYNQYKMLTMRPGLAHFEDYLNNLMNKVDSLTKRCKSCSPQARIKNNLSELDYLLNLLNKNYSNLIENKNNHFMHDINKLIILNPLNLMDKGYSLIYQENHLITSIDEVDQQKELKTLLKDGEIISTIQKINKKEED